MESKKLCISNMAELRCHSFLHRINPPPFVEKPSEHCKV